MEALLKSRIYLIFSGVCVFVALIAFLHMAFSEGLGQIFGLYQSETVLLFSRMTALTMLSTFVGVIIATIYHFRSKYSKSKMLAGIVVGISIAIVIVSIWLSFQP